LSPGADADNYYNLTSTITALANITKFDVTGSSADNKVYDSNNSAVAVTWITFMAAVLQETYILSF
jgi:hypothetical protein